MTDETQVDIDISVNGTPSIAKAADALAAINQNLRDTGRSIAAAVNQLDRLEQSLAGVTKRGTAGFNSMAKAAQNYYKVASTQKGQSVTLAPTTESPSLRNASGQFQNQAQYIDNVNRALAHNSTELERSRTNFGRVTAANNTFGQATQQSYSRLQLLNFALNENADNLPRMRYALYDVAFALGIVGVALTAAAVAPVAMAIQFERSFADVRRTTGVTGDAAEQLQNDLIELSQTIPVSFSQISQIATLAGQLGIANTNVENFTETVAKFAATTDVTIEASATAFGRLDSLLDDVRGNYEALGSSIINVGINSVATESQIINITSQIAAAGSQAGLSADEVIGLSGALASLGVAPEAARGTILRVFSQINSAIAQGGERLESFGRVAGLSGEAFAQGWNDDFTGTFVQFLEGVNAQGGSAETALRALGITAARDVNTMLKLSQNFQDVAEYLGLAKEGFEDATQLGANFEIIAGTVASKLEVLSNNFQALIATIGESSLGPVGAFVDLLNGILSGLQAITSNPVGQFFTGLALVITGLAGALTLMAATAAVGAAGLLAFKTVAASSMIATLGLSGAVTALGTAIKVGLISTGIGIAVVLIGTLVAGIMQLSGAFDTAADRANKYFGDISGLADAIRRDNQAAVEAGAAFAQVTTTIKTASDVTPEWVDELENATGAQAQVADSLQTTNSGLETQTYSLRDNTKAWLANTVANDENIQKIFAMREELEQYGFNSDDFVAAILGDPENGAQEYVARIQAAFAKEVQAGLEADGIWDAENLGLGTAEAAFWDVAQVANEYGNAVAAAADQVALFGIVQEQLGTAADGTTELFGEATRQILDNVDAIYESSNAQAELESNTEALGEAFANQGASAAANGSELQAVIASIIGTSATTGQAANSLQGLFDAIVAGGYASASQLILLQQVIASLGGSTGSTAFNMAPFTQGLQKAGGAAGGASKKVRTLVDYANDLQKVMSRSFEIRFGSALAMDDITGKFNDLNEELQEYLVKLQKLQADRSIQEYFLSVAEAYGDSLRAGSIRAEIADIDEQIADAQSVTNKTLVGNSEAAINNRKVITDLIGDYQDYIQALAASGASQATLQAAVAQSRAGFLSQAQALGFALPELQNYSVAFDDMTVAINKVPRNITVKFDANPALQALNEFVAQARTAGGSAGSSFAKGMQDGFAKAARGALISAEIQKIIGQMTTYKHYSTAAAARLATLQGQLASGNYAQGGAIRGPGTATSDSIPINAPDGEFMFRQRAVAGLGTPLLNYMNKYGRLPGFATGGQIGTPSATSALLGGVIELGPKSLGILREAVNREVGLYLDPMGVARLSDQGHKQMAYGG